VNAPEISVVVPVHNEEDNVAPLIEEIVAAMRGKASFEIVYVDDHSRDETALRLRHALDFYPELRLLRH
jgi:dolichol-phosphate mannosyltransferase